MDEMISRVKDFSSINKNIKQVIMFDQSIKDIDIINLYNDFGLTKEKMEKSMNSYRDVGIVLELLKMDEEYKTDWGYYIKKFILPGSESSKFDNILISKDQKRLLMLTNRRLYRVDLRHLNNKVDQINRDITIYNEPVPEAKKPERRTLMGAIKKIFS